MTFYDFLSSKTDINVGHRTYRKLRNKHNKMENFFFLGYLEVTDEKIRIRIQIWNQVYRSKDPDPNQNFTDQEHSW